MSKVGYALKYFPKGAESLYLESSTTAKGGKNENNKWYLLESLQSLTFNAPILVANDTRHLCF